MIDSRTKPFLSSSLPFFFFFFTFWWRFKIRAVPQSGFPPEWGEIGKAPASKLLVGF